MKSNRIFVPQSGIEPRPLAVKVPSPNHWTTREFPQRFHLNLPFFVKTFSVRATVKMRYWRGLSLGHTSESLRAFLVAQMVKNPHAVHEIRFWFLVWEEALEKGAATHSSILACIIPWTEEPGQVLVHGVRVRSNWVTNNFTFSIIESESDKWRLPPPRRKESTFNHIYLQ